MLQTIATDHNLGFYHGSCLCSRSLLIMQDLIVHLADVRSDLKVAKDFAELSNAFDDEGSNSLRHNVISTNVVVVIACALGLLVRCPMVGK